MIELIRDWLLDPAALLFLSSSALVLWLFSDARRRARVGSTFPNTTGSPSAQSTSSGKTRRWSVLAIMLWLILYVLSTAPVVVNPMIVALERPYLSDHHCELGSHLVLLGGGVDSRVQSASDFSRMRSATFIRSTVASQIARAEPDLRVIIAGGALKHIAEANVIAEYLQATGIAESRMVLESRSSNTRENAVNVAQLLGVENVTGTVRLVTSALHMRRALSTFEHVFDGTGLVFCPVATDAQGLLDIPAHAWMPQTTSLVKFDLLLHELVALLVYRLRGWT